MLVLGDSLQLKHPLRAHRSVSHPAFYHDTIMLCSMYHRRGRSPIAVSYPTYLNIQSIHLDNLPTCNHETHELRTVHARGLLSGCFFGFSAQPPTASRLKQPEPNSHYYHDVRMPRRVASCSCILRTRARGLGPRDVRATWR